MKYIQPKLFSKPKHAVPVEMPCDSLPTEMYYFSLLPMVSTSMVFKVCTDQRLQKYMCSTNELQNEDTLACPESLLSVIAVASNGSPVVCTLSDKGVFKCVLYASSVFGGEDNTEVIGVLIGLDHTPCEDSDLEVDVIGEADVNVCLNVTDEILSRSSSDQSNLSSSSSSSPITSSPPSPTTANSSAWTVSDSAAALIISH